MIRSIFLRDDLRLSAAKTGEGKTFVFQHGLCGTASQPVEVFPKDIGWRCLTLECRGHGLSQSGDHQQFSIVHFADDLCAFIESLNVGPVLVGGISMGAAIAMRTAVTHPELVSGLVIVRPAWIDSSAPENLSPNREVASLLATYEPTEALLRFQASPTAAQLRRDAPDNLTSLTGFFNATRVTETQALLAAISSDGPRISRDEIAGLQCPTLVIGTARDAIHPLTMAQEIATLVPRAQFAEITPKADSPEKYRAELREVLRLFMTEIDECPTA
jgi:pimeloyl-ACP methyl ester carboxylesterase